MTETKPLTKPLTQIKPLTFLDYLCHSALIFESQEKNSTAACWLVTDEKIRQAERKKTLDQYNSAFAEACRRDGAPRPSLTEENFDEYCLARIALAYRRNWEDWVRAEIDREKLRAEGNPRAFFV